MLPKYTVFYQTQKSKNMQICKNMHKNVVCLFQSYEMYYLLNVGIYVCMYISIQYHRPESKCKCI